MCGYPHYSLPYYEYAEPFHWMMPFMGSMGTMGMLAPVMMFRPVVRHGVAEFANGAPLAHVLYQVAGIGYLMGQGYSPEMAIRMFEQMELPLLGRMFL